ncbi:FtsJ methyltransferase family protein [Salix suchowensis]|nr:FtsJ methyltransferase family protein [Salix suchowensis]
MGKVKGKHRLDKFYKLAKEHGYRSRASWKLIQLDTKFRFLHSSRAVLDLCAAPGGWMQVAVQRVPVGSLVLGIDLVKIAPLRGAVSIEQDITKPECKAKIKKIMGDNGVRAFDLVLHDGSPNIGGAWSQEAMTQNSLVIDSVRLATQFLAPKGTFVTKVFRSQDYSSVIYCLNQLFEKVEVDKPAASRSASAEIFVLGLRYKAPAKIDPRLLDVKHLFQGSVEPQRKVVDVLRGTKQKRHRDGYEDGESIIRKVSSAADFVWSDNPLEILGKHLCDDLRVLGKQDFKHLLKWRMQIRKALSSSQKASPTIEKDGKDEKEDDEDDRLLNEMEELTSAMERKKKREKKLLSKRRAKDKVRKATGGMQIDATADGYTDLELFSLSSIKGKKDLVAVDAADYDHENGGLRDGENEETDEDTQEHSPSDVDSDEEHRRFDEQMEEILDQAYERFVIKREGSTKQRKRAKQAYAEQLLEGDGDIVHSDYDSDKEMGDREANPLMVPFNDGEVPTEEEITRKWFDQDIFAKAAEDGDLETAVARNLEKFESEDEMLVDGQEEEIVTLKKPAKKAAGSDRTQPPSSMAENDFEIVPAPAMDSSDDSSSDESEDDDKKAKEQMLDDAYNKYMFDDEGLPGWFVEEEKRHRQPIKPVTKEEMDAMRAQFKEINARPAKKVAEAKARKKRVATRKLEKVRKKANVISKQTEISDRSKGKLIEQLYKKATPKRPKKEYVVAKKGVTVKVGKGKVLVDRRMKKDARGMGKPGKGGLRKGKNAKGQRGKGPSKTSAKGNKGKKGKKMGTHE